MELPLPNVIADMQAGGPLVTALKGMNALTKANLETQYYAPKTESDINYKNALTKGQEITNEYMPDKLRLANVFSDLENNWYGPKAQALINSQNALATTRQNGGIGGGVGAKEQLFYQNLVAKDNPQLTTQEQIYEAANVLAEGGTQLSDGTPLKPLSPAARASLSRIIKGTTTAPILTGNVRAAQADAELGVLNDYAQKGLEPYGTTFAGYSPSQVMDSFRTDNASQIKLGRFIASQALQYEAAQNRIRLANGQPGVTSTEELVKLSGQMLKTAYPKLSYTARKEASRYLDEALKEGLKARNSIDISAIANKGGKGSQNTNNGEEPKITIKNKKTGEIITVPLSEAKEKYGVNNV